MHALSILLLTLSISSPTNNVPSDPVLHGYSIKEAWQAGTLELVEPLPLLAPSASVTLNELSYLAAYDVSCLGCRFVSGTAELEDPGIIDPDFTVQALWANSPGNPGKDGACGVTDGVCKQKDGCGYAINYLVSLPSTWTFGHIRMVLRQLPDGTLYWQTLDAGQLTQMPRSHMWEDYITLWGFCGETTRFQFGAMSPDGSVFVPMFNVTIACESCYWDAVWREI